MSFPNQFPLDEPGKLEIQFDNLLVENLQRKWCRQVKKQKKMERCRRREREEETSTDHIKDADNGLFDAETEIDSYKINEVIEINY